MKKTLFSTPGNLAADQLDVLIQACVDSISELNELVCITKEQRVHRRKLKSAKVRELRELKKIREEVTTLSLIKGNVEAIGFML